jgi:hypothetical protein
MRFYEFQVEGDDEFVLLLKNLVGRAQSKKAPAKFNWASINTLLKNTNQGQLDYDAFKQMYDMSPVLQKLVYNFNADGIELNVPGVGQDQNPSQSQVDKSKEEVNKIAAQAAPKMIDKGL